MISGSCLLYTSDSSIIFPNGWVASVAPNKGVTIYDSSGISRKEYPSNKKYSVAMCDYCLLYTSYPVCNPRLFRVKGRENVKECRYCTSKFIKIQPDEKLDADTETFFVMGKTARTRCV